MRFGLLLALGLKVWGEKERKGQEGGGIEGEGS